MKINKLSFLLVFFIYCESYAQGSPPLMTDDSGVPGGGKWENNIGFAYEGNGEDHSLEGPIIDLNYGIGNHVQLKYEMAWIAENGEHLANKFDAILVGVKYNFSDGKNKDYELSLYPQAIFSFNNESGKNIEYGFILSSSLTKEFEPITLNVQLGYEQIGSESHGFYGFSAGKEFGESLTLSAEFHGSFAKAHVLEVAGEHEFYFNEETWVNIGATYKVTEILSIQGALGRKLSTDSTPEHGGEFFGYGGLQFLL